MSFLVIDALPPYASDGAIYNLVGSRKFLWQNPQDRGNPSSVSRLVFESTLVQPHRADSMCINSYRPLTHTHFKIWDINQPLLWMGPGGCNQALLAELQRLKKHPAALQGKVEKSSNLCKHPLTQCERQPGENQSFQCRNGSTKLFTTLGIAMSFHSVLLTVLTTRTTKDRKKLFLTRETNVYKTSYFLVCSTAAVAPVCVNTAV